MTGSITIAPPSTDAVAFQINPQHTGAISFNSVALPASSIWSVTVGGTPAYALIADGKVFATSTSTAGGTADQSQLVALNQTTGAIAWGPVVIPGQIDAAYDNGAFFVMDSTVGSGAVLRAYDGQTGTLKWTVSFPQDNLPTPLVAVNGLVFTGNSTPATAIEETTGAIEGSGSASAAQDFSIIPAVTADGVYLGDEGVTDDFDPVTGNLLWQNAQSASNAHSGVPVAANGIVYSPNTAESGSFNGTEFNAESGAVLGGFNAYYPPAIGATTGYFLAIVAGQSNTLSAVNLATGAVLWQQSLGGAGPPGPGWNPSLPYSGLSAGDGLLVAPAGDTVTAYILSSNP